MALAGAPMAKAKGRPKSSTRADVSTKFDQGLLGMARMVAKAKNVSLAEYISEAARATIERDFASEMRRLSSQEN